MATLSGELERVMDGVLLKASVALMVIDLPRLSSVHTSIMHGAP